MRFKSVDKIKYFIFATQVRDPINNFLKLLNVHIHTGFLSDCLVLLPGSSYWIQYTKWSSQGSFKVGPAIHYNRVFSFLPFGSFHGWTTEQRKAKWYCFAMVFIFVIHVARVKVPFEMTQPIINFTYFTPEWYRVGQTYVAGERHRTVIALRSVQR